MYQPLSFLSKIFIAVVGLYVYIMYMKMVILSGSCVTVDSIVEAVILYSLNSICFTCVLASSRLPVCAGCVPSYKIKHCTFGCFVLFGTWLPIPLRHISPRAALRCKYQQST